jgi:hypothetical protein
VVRIHNGPPFKTLKLKQYPFKTDPEPFTLLIYSESMH